MNIFIRAMFGTAINITIMCRKVSVNNDHCLKLRKNFDQLKEKLETKRTAAAKTTTTTTLLPTTRKAC